VRFLPLLDEPNFRGLLSASDVCLVTQQKTSSEIAFPSKIVTYLAAGCPVIASVSSESEVARIVMESGAGAVADAESGAALLEAILELRKTDLEEMGHCAHAYALRRWSAERVLGHLECSLADAAFPMRSLAHKETSQ
jgi:glycosyltransferase involved in cell wall biosynthesis